MNTLAPTELEPDTTTEAAQTSCGFSATLCEPKAEQQSNSFWNGISLPKLLRALGALVLLSSAAVFLVQQCDVVHDHVARFYSFLGFTVVLSALGFFCGLRMREDKGARTFLALACAIVPANVCQLGALIYSRFYTDTGAFPVYALLQAPSNTSALLATLGGCTALTVVSLVAFTALARKSWKIVSLSYMCLNALLLIPTRDPNTIGALILLGAFGLAYIETIRLRLETSLKTTEGLFIRLMLLTPVLLLVARTIHLYSVSPFFLSALLAALAVLLLIAVRPHAKSVAGQDRIVHIATVPALAAATCFGIFLTTEFPALAHYSIVLFFGAWALATLSVSPYLRNGASRYRSLALNCFMTGLMTEMVTHATLLVSFIAIAAGIACAAAAYQAKNLAGFIGSLLVLVAGLTHHLHLAMAIYQYSPWISLAVLGALTILSASFIEQHHRSLLLRIHGVKAHFTGC